MKVAVFWGCKILTSQYAYEMSMRRVFPKIGIELVDLKEQQCCGEPVKNINFFSAYYMAARVLALAQQTELRDLLVPCNRGHLMLTETKHTLKRNDTLKERINKLLNEEKLDFPENIKIWHVIDLLHDKVGVEQLTKTVKKKLNGLTFATHVGCQLIRPSEIGRVDDAENPKKLDRLVEALGAKIIDYEEKLDCCGAALLETHRDAALSLAGSKIQALQSLEVDGLITCCPHCHTMFDSQQKSAETTIGTKLNMPIIYYTQLLGLALGIKPEELGLNLNQSSVEEIFKKMEVS